MNYSKQLQGIVSKYRKAGNSWPASKRGIAAWAVREKLWEPHPNRIISQCADELGRAMREEYITDPQGRRVRAKHVVRSKDQGEQMALWGDIRTEDRGFMATSFQQRRQGIFGDCHQLKTDLDSFNQNGNQDKPIQIIFDFTVDLEEEDGLNSVA